MFALFNYCFSVFFLFTFGRFLFFVLRVVFAFLLYFSRVPDEADLSFKQLFKASGRIKRADSAKKKVEESTKETVAENGNTSNVIFYIIPLSLLALYLGSMLSGFIFRGTLTFFPTLFKEEIHFITNHDEPVVVAGFLTTAVLSFGLFGAWFGGWINDKLKTPEFFPAIVFFIVTPVLFLISRFTDSKLIVVSCLFSLVYYAWQPAQNFLIAKYTKKASHGMGFGVNFFLIFGVGSIATATGGYVTDDFGVDLFYQIMAIVSLFALGAGTAVYFLKRNKIRFSWQIEKDK